ncbi:mitochondrial carrier domain-containing protein [Obelidium mucronatum]|nr:mitochondrial carrier domain-containing protein [Obelidium mucronatum]
MVQSYKPGHQKYKNSWSALVQIIREEGWKSLYYNRYMAPKILLELVMAASDSVIPLVLVRYFGLQMKSVRYGVSRFALGMVFSLAVMPLDTIVRRMQAQIVVSCQKADSRGVVQFKTTVATDQVPYKNMGDCIERVVREEERALKKRGTKGKGWGALYRGWQSAILLNLINALFESHLDEYAGL